MTHNPRVAPARAPRGILEDLAPGRSQVLAAAARWDSPTAAISRASPLSLRQKKEGTPARAPRLHDSLFLIWAYGLEGSISILLLSLTAAPLALRPPGAGGLRNPPSPLLPGLSPGSG